MLRRIFRYLVPARTLFLLFFYAFLLALGLWIAYALRFDFFIPPRYRDLFLSNLLWMLPLQLVLLFLFGQFGGLLSFFRLPDLYRLFGALLANGFILVYLWYSLGGWSCPPRSVILGNLVFSFVLISLFRVGLRVGRERFFSGMGNRPKKARRVAILGAGDVGAGVAASLLGRRGLGLRPVVFLDHDKSKWKKTIHGIRVVDSPDNLAIVKDNFRIEEIVIAMPSAPTRRIREIIKRAGDLNLKAEIIPSLTEITTGKVQTNRVRPVEIEDLLGRDPVPLDSITIEKMLENKVIMVTGAGGSIGRELCRQIAFRKPRLLLLIDQSEGLLFQTEQELIEEGYGEILVPLPANILDAPRMRFLLEKHHPGIIFHAAAHKHVFLMEGQPGEVLKNNALGTKILADLAGANGVERFIFISTDKAVNPTSIMGASKRLAEMYLQRKQKEENNRTRFMAVRFGNVLGSSGSVVPIFRKQISRGGPVKVTHPEVTRYFMTVAEAVGLVLQSATQGSGGEIFVLDMGVPVKIVDLARQMIELSGFRPEIDIEIEYIGLRPGEKLFEEVQHGSETLEKTPHPRILRFTRRAAPEVKLEKCFQTLPQIIDALDPNALKKELHRTIPEYEPFLDQSGNL